MNLSSCTCIYINQYVLHLNTYLSKIYYCNRVEFMDQFLYEVILFSKIGIYSYLNLEDMCPVLFLIYIKLQITQGADISDSSNFYWTLLWTNKCGWLLKPDFYWQNIPCFFFCILILKNPNLYILWLTILSNDNNGKCDFSII